MYNHFTNFLYNIIIYFTKIKTLIITSQILFIIIIINILAKKEKPTSMLAWILAILFVPYISIPLYFIIGNRKRKQKYIKLTKLKVNNINIKNDVIKLFINEGIPKPSKNNFFELYDNGIQAYHTLIKEIKKSKKSIYISTYVFQQDQVSIMITKELSLKAKKGVEVKILIDALGSYKLYFNQSLFNELKQYGGIVNFFMPILNISFRNYINYRNHRKMYIFDKKTVLTGGMNIGNEYLGPDAYEKRWSDLLFKIKGEAVYNFYKIFISDWNFSTKNIMKENFFVNKNIKKKFGNNNIQIVPSGPDIQTDAMYHGLILSIYNAKKKIWIVTPYFIPSDSLFEALKIASLKGVKIKIITPKYSNHKIADIARSIYMRKLKKYGIEISLLNNMIHAKSVLIDNTLVMLGSVNIDNRSLFLNYEIAIFVYQKNIILLVETWMLKLLHNNKNNIYKPNKNIHIAENLIKIFVPLL